MIVMRFGLYSDWMAVAVEDPLTALLDSILAINLVVTLGHVSSPNQRGQQWGKIVHGKESASFHYSSGRVHKKLARFQTLEKCPKI